MMQYDSTWTGKRLMVLCTMAVHVHVQTTQAQVHHKLHMTSVFCQYGRENSKG